MQRQQLLNIAGVGSIQTLVNEGLKELCETIDDDHPRSYSVAVDGMFGPKTLAALNKYVGYSIGEAIMVPDEEISLPPLPEMGYWENGIDVFQIWYKEVYRRFLDRYKLTPLLRPQTDGKWGPGTSGCLVSLFDRRSWS